MERGKYLTCEEIDIVCKIYCRNFLMNNFCTDCPILREGRRDRKAYFQRYYQEVTKKKRQEVKKK